MKPVIVIALAANLSLAGCQNPTCNSSLYPFANRMHPPVDLSLTQVPTARPVPDVLASRLRSEWARLRNDGAVAELAVAVSGLAGNWVSPMPDGVERFYWASVGKLATAVLLQQLAQEDRLQLHERLSHWYPTLPGAGDITLEMMLSHRAGFPSHNEYEAFRGGSSPARPEDVVRFLETHPLIFCPGTDWYYSNSAYVLLGRIIEQVTGDSFSTAVAARIAEPIGARSLSAIRQGENPSDVASARPADSAAPVISPGDPFSAGNIVASPQDMVRLLAAVLNGRLVSGAARAALARDLYPMFDERLYYGLGLMVYDLPDDTWVGHSGGIPGAKAVLAYSLKSRSYAAVALTGDGSAESIARLFMRELETPAPGTRSFQRRGP